MVGIALLAGATLLAEAALAGWLESCDEVVNGVELEDAKVRGPVAANIAPIAASTIPPYAICVFL